MAKAKSAAKKNGSVRHRGAVALRTTEDPRPATAPISIRPPLPDAERGELIGKILDALRYRGTFGKSPDDIGELLGRLDGCTYPKFV